MATAGKTGAALDEKRRRLQQALGPASYAAKGASVRGGKKAPLGSGERFKAVEAQARKSGARDPAAVAAEAGRKKYGKQRFQQLAAAGRKRANR